MRRRLMLAVWLLLLAGVFAIGIGENAYADEAEASETAGTSAVSGEEEEPAEEIVHAETPRAEALTVEDDTETQPSQGEPSSETSTESSTDTSTESSTETSTESPTETSTEPSTEPSTQPEPSTSTPQNPAVVNPPAPASTVEAEGWHTTSNGSKYYIQNGKRLKSVTKKIKSSWWIFDKNGIAKEHKGTVYEAGTSVFKPGNRVWFMNVCGGAFNSDFLIVESKGHWGLIDTGNRYSNVIQDSNGTIYKAPWKYPDGTSANLSCQKTYKNGRDAAIYMIQTLGITHLDFIIGSHSHSDHIGGIPEIADIRLFDGKTIHSLIDKNTLFLKKKYRHTSPINDDLGSVKNEESWHTQAFSYQAALAIKQSGGTIVDVSNGQKTANTKQKVNNYSKIVKAISKFSFTSKVSYSQGSLTDYFDDYIQFNWGKLKLRLYNLYAVHTAVDDNTNSIAVVISDGKRQLFTAGDLNVSNQVQQKVCRAVHKSFKNVEVVKACDHGTQLGFSKEHLDLFRPKVVIKTNGQKGVILKDGGSYSAGMHYASKKYGTVSYEVGASDRAIVAEFGTKGFNIYQLTGKKTTAGLKSAKSCKSQFGTLSGWVQWNQGGTKLFYYFKSNKAVTGWKKMGSNHYYFASNGLMQTGWVKSSGKWYYLKSNGVMQTGWLNLEGKKYYLSPKTGEACTGWKTVDGKRIHFGNDGALSVGLTTVDSKRLFFGEDGTIDLRWRNIGNNWYYTGANGKQKTGWLIVGTRWYHFASNGAMQTGWAKIGNNRYFFRKDGTMVTGTVKIKGKTQRFSASGVWKGSK